MKKLFIILSVISLVNLLNAQIFIKPIGKKVVKNYEGKRFSAIDIDAPVKIILKQTDSKSKTIVKIQGDSIFVSLLKITFHNGIFKIKWNSKKTIESQYYPVVNIFVNNLNQVNLSYSSELVAISKISFPSLSVNQSGASSMKIPIFSGNTLNLTISGASDLKIINIEKEINKLTADISGASDVTINKGKNIQKAKLNISGASEIKMAQIPIQEATVDVSGNSDAYLMVIQTLTADISGISTLTLSKKPKKLNKDISGNSEIKFSE